MFGIAGTAELSTFCPGTGTWNRLQDGTMLAGVIMVSLPPVGSAAVQCSLQDVASFLSGRSQLSNRICHIALHV